MHTSAPSDDRSRIDTIVSLCKRRGFVFPSSEIYGGINALYDFGPIGTRLRRNIRNSWWRYMVESRDDVEGIETSVIMNPRVWEASGHVQNFTDPLVDCLGKCKKRWREDHLEDERRARKLPEGSTGCPECGGDLTPARQFNLMFRSYLGPVEDSAAQVWLRPETAQGMFVNFANVVTTSRARVPFGIAQIGKGFRNEISPGNFIFRSREFELMEMEFFCEPGTDDEWYAFWKKYRFDWYLDELGIQESHLRIREHEKAELSHYSSGTSDIEYAFPFGWGELEGVACRTDYDLTTHQKMSGKDLSYFDPKKEIHYVPHVIEPAVSVDRIFLTVLVDAYEEEQVNGEERVVLRLHPDLAPYQVAVLPLSKNEQLMQEAHSIEKSLRGTFATAYDDTQSIGKRYRRHDEIGTPLAVTVDFDTLVDHAVTIRNRDTMTQDRVAIADLSHAIGDHLGRARRDSRARAHRNASSQQ